MNYFLDIVVHQNLEFISDENLRNELIDVISRKKFSSTFSVEDIVDAIDVIEEAQSMKNAKPKDIDSFKKAVKSAKGKAAKKQAKKALKGAIAYNENIEISKMVNEEVEKFDREEWKLRLEEAKRIYANGIDGLSDVSDEELERAMANAKAMPKDTKKHREERSAAIETVRNRKYSKKDQINCIK